MAAGHHHVPGHADTERQTCPGPDQRAQPPLAVVDFPTRRAKQQNTTSVFRHAPCIDPGYSAQNEDAFVHGFDAPFAVAPLRSSITGARRHRGQIRECDLETPRQVRGPRDVGQAHPLYLSAITHAAATIDAGRSSHDHLAGIMSRQDVRGASEC